MSTDNHWREIAEPIRLEVGSLEAKLAMEATERVAEAVVLAIDFLDEDDLALGQLQKQRLVYTAIRAFDGYQQAVRKELDQEIDLAERIAEARREREEA